MNNKQQPTAEVQASDTRKCPVCGHEAWPIAYGMMTADQEQTPKTVYAGCCLQMLARVNPLTGEQEMGIAEWECQNPDCGHQWW
ncbi:MAG TPA: hypothetical protein VIG41_02820 [Micrococcaceae bacterium]